MYCCTALQYQTPVLLYCPQYQTLDPDTKQYTTSSEMSIEFEVDGPYQACVVHGFLRGF